MHTLPDILLLHLQRLVITSTGGGKIRTLVKFPLSRLDMQPFTTGRVLACWSVYVLYVVVYVVVCYFSTVYIILIYVNVLCICTVCVLNTEQKERVAALADSTHPSDHTEQLLQQLGTADGSSSSSKDVYELYGVVNHIGRTEAVTLYMRLKCVFSYTCCVYIVYMMYRGYAWGTLHCSE